MTKNALFEYFKTETLKNGWNVWNQPSQISHNAVLLENIYRILFFLGCKLEKLSRYLRSSLSKMSKRKVLCRIWDQKRIFWVILDWNLKELLYFKPVPPNLSNFRAKIKLLKFETKNASCEYFRIVILINYCCIWNPRPRISQNAKFCPKVKILEFWDQKCLI